MDQEIIQEQKQQFEIKEKSDVVEEHVFEDFEGNFKTDEEVARELAEKYDMEMREKEEAELKERRYRRLIHLLTNSKMYSGVLKDRLQQDKASARKDSNQNGKIKSGGKYYLSDVITEKNIDDAVQSSEKGISKENCEDYFKETRITSLGFTVSSKQPILLEGGVMRDYQLKGLDWMKNMFVNGVNGILADEMGLGKTIQVISFICHMIEENIEGPFLIVVPLSTACNWMSEFQRFAPKVPVMLYYGSKEERQKLLPLIFHKSEVMNLKCYKVVITSYQVPLKDKSILKNINWYYLIIDEGHRIKNHNSLLSKTLSQFNTIGRLLLTGTPLQNNLSELWSLLNFLLPEVFNSLDVFESWFDIKELESNGAKFMQEKFNIDVVTIMQEILVPFLLRREKKDVNVNLPPKKTVLIYCPMTPQQNKLYQLTIDQNIELLLKKKETKNEDEPLPKRRCFLNSPYGKNHPKIKKHRKREKHVSENEEETFPKHLTTQNPQMVLRKIVNHPYLIQYPLKDGTDYQVNEDLVRSSGKLLVLDAMLAGLKKRGHKVVIFSYFKIVLNILEDHAILRGYKYCRLDGELTIQDRQQEISNFMSDPDIFVFYMSIRAGGLGINLNSADTVIFFDNDWNPQVNLQCEDRCHRIGQTKPVAVYRLCTVGTIDEKIIERGNAKRRLEKMILQNGKYTLNSQSTKNLNVMDLEDLKKLFESVNHDIVIKSNGFDEDLEAILDRTDMSDINSEIFSYQNKDKKLLKICDFV